MNLAFVCLDDYTAMLSGLSDIAVEDDFDGKLARADEVRKPVREFRVVMPPSRDFRVKAIFRIHNLNNAMTDRSRKHDLKCIAESQLLQFRPVFLVQPLCNSDAVVSHTKPPNKCRIVSSGHAIT